MVVEHEQVAVRLQRVREAAAPDVEVVQAREDALAGVDEVEAAAPQLGRQRLRLADDPEDRRPPLARRVEPFLPRVDARDDGAELGQLRRGGAAAAEDVEHALSVQVAERLTHDRRQSRCVRGATVRVVEHPPVEVGRLHHARSEKPPSTTIVCPRIISASGEARNDTTAAMSSGAASRPAGVRSTVRSISSLFGKNSSASVSTTPPETALTRIPRGPSSTPR